MVGFFFNLQMFELQKNDKTKANICADADLEKAPDFSVSRPPTIPARHRRVTHLCETRRREMLLTNRRITAACDVAEMLPIYRAEIDQLERPTGIERARLRSHLLCGLEDATSTYCSFRTTLEPLFLQSLLSKMSIAY